MDNEQENSSTNATSNDIKTDEIAPTTLTVLTQESQGSSEWASRTLDALGPAIDIPYPADGVNNTDAAAESYASEEVNNTQAYCL